MTVAEPVRAEAASIVAEEMGRFPVPGVSIGVASGDDEWTAGFGITSVEDPLAVGPDTLFQIGSITRWSWEHYLGVPPSVPEARTHTAAEARGVAGTYRNPSSELRIALEDSGLVLHQQPLDSGFRKLQRNPPPVPKPAALAFTTTGRLVVRGGPLTDSQIELLGPEWIRFSSRLHRKERG